MRPHRDRIRVLVTIAALATLVTQAPARANASSSPAGSADASTSAIDINLAKTGPDSANVGDAITYTFTVTTTGARLHNVVLTDDSTLCDSGPTFQAGDDGDGFLEAGESWVFTCPHTVTLTDPDPLSNQATVSAADDNGQTISDSDTHIVDILHPDLTVTKTAAAGEVSAGDPASFTMTLTVGGDVGSIARSATLTDALPGGLAWTVNPGVNGCGINNATLSCAFGDLAVGATRTVTVTAATSSCGVLLNTVDVSATNELITNNNTASDSITVDCPDLTVTKTADVATISAGDTAAFTLSVASSGATAQSVTVTDPLPGGVDWTINPAVDGCSISNGVLVCSFGSVAPDAPVTIHVSGTTDAADCGVLSNTATVAAANESAADTGNNTSTATITVNCADVTVTKTADVAIISAGDTAAFTLSVASSGATAQSVTVTDPLPGGVDWTINPAVDGCSISNGVLVCSFGSVAPDAPVTIHVSGTTDAADCGVLSNTAAVSAANELPSATSNNSATATIQVGCAIGMSIENVGPTAAHVGDTITYQMTVANTAQTPFTTVLVTNPACNAGTLTLVDDGNGDAVLDVGESWVYTCTHLVLATDPDPLVSTASVLGTAADTRTASDTDAWTVDIAHPSISVTLSATPNPVHLGQLVTLTYLVQNIGDTLLADIVVTDDQFGLIGSVPSLDIGASVTFTRTVRATPLGTHTHVATVTAHDTVATNVSVSDSDEVAIKVLPARGRHH